MNVNYKSLGITSQLPFCSVPLRLDAYSQCSFGCTYCFAKSRGGNFQQSKLKLASADALSKRLERVSNGSIASAVDEMLQRRIPIQFGGMTDPFSHFEMEFSASKAILETLNRYDYPTLISTKGADQIDRNLASILRDGNYLVRISFSGADPALTKRIEPGTPSRSDRLRVIELLASSGCAVGVRLQPIIPLQENCLEELVRDCASAGAQIISAEYLKWPLESTGHQSKLLSKLLGENIRSIYRSASNRNGREWILPQDYRLRNLLELKKIVEAHRMVFGFAENDLLHLNAFRSCCNAADMILRSANYFDCNISSALKHSMGGEANYSFFSDKWRPSHMVGTYLNSKSRAPKGVKNDWEYMLKRKWNSTSIDGAPIEFLGVKDSGKLDGDGNSIFVVSSVV